MKYFIGGIIFLSLFGVSFAQAAVFAPPIYVFHEAQAPVSTMSDTKQRLSIDPETLARFFRYLHDQKIPTLTMREYAAARAAHKKIPARAVVLTFDDGTRDFYEIIFPLLKFYGLRATLYANPGLDGVEDRMNLSMLRGIATCGCLEIGAHTLTHPHLKDLSEEAMREEIVGSKQMLENLIGKPVTAFAYPYGENNARVVRVVKEAGFVSAVIADNTRPVTDNFLLPRISLGEFNIKKATQFVARR